MGGLGPEEVALGLRQVGGEGLAPVGVEVWRHPPHGPGGRAISGVLAVPVLWCGGGGGGRMVHKNQPLISDWQHSMYIN